MTTTRAAAMVSVLVRLSADEAAAIDRVIDRGRRTEYIRALIRRDMARRGELPREVKPR